MPLSTGSSSTTKELKNTKNSEVVRRPTQQVCGVCEVKLRNDEPVCKRWKCEYYYASERAAYWLHRSGVARTHLNYSSEKHVDGDGVGQLTMACKCCDKLISNGCGQERCDVLCPWCVCDTRLCRNRIYKQFQWYALPRRCFARGCDVIISGEVLSVFGTDKTAVSLTDSDGQEFVACGECRSGDHPEVYCKEHGAHYYHSWDSWLPDKKRKRATPIKKTRRKAKKAAIETVVRLAPVTMPAMVVPNIPNFLDHMQISPPTPTPDPSFECLFDNVDIDHLSNDLDLDIFSSSSTLSSNV